MSEKRVAVFVDWANVFRQVNVDIVKFRQFLDSLGTVIYACAYMVDFTRLQKEGDPKEARRSPSGFWDLVKRQGFNLRLKRVRVIQREYGNDLHKANWDVGMTVDIMKAVQGGRVDEIILFSGDGDFEDLVREIRGLPYLVRVTVCARGKNTAGVLRYCANKFIDFDEHLAGFSRPYDGQSRREIVEEASEEMSGTSVTISEEAEVAELQQGDSGVPELD